MNDQGSEDKVVRFEIGAEVEVVDEDSDHYGNTGTVVSVGENLVHVEMVDGEGAVTVAAFSAGQLEVSEG